MDVESFAQEIEGLKATVDLVMDGVNKIFESAESGAQTASTTIERSFTNMALTTAKEADGVAKVFQGTAGAIAAIWEALANNIPAYFSNAWAEVKSGAAGFVNDLADLINRPIQALGGEGIGHVSVDTAPIQAIIDLSDAAAEGWQKAAQGVGAYERTLDRVTNNAIDSAIADWESQYTEEAKKAVAATESRAAASDKLTAAQHKEIRAHEQNQKTLDGILSQKSAILKAWDQPFPANLAAVAMVAAETDLPRHRAPVLPQRLDRGRPLPRRAAGEPALHEAVAAVRSRRPQEPGSVEPHASPSLEALGRAKGAPASVSGPVARAAGAVLCQAAAQRLPGAQGHESQAGQQAAAQVPGAAAPVRTKSGQGAGGYVNIVAGARRAHVALLQVQRHHRGLPYQDGDALAQGLWV